MKCLELIYYMTGLGKPDSAGFWELLDSLATCRVPYIWDKAELSSSKASIYVTTWLEKVRN